MSVDKQIDNTIKVLLMLLVEPRLSQNQIAKTIGVNPSTVTRMLERFREYGLQIEYNFETKRYEGSFSETLQKTLLGKFATKLKRTVTEASFSQPTVRFVQELDRYTLSQFAEHMGTSEQNVYNMIMGYKGQTLPTGWVAFQIKSRGKWAVQKMLTDRSGKKFELPPNIKDAFRYAIGEGKPVSVEAKSMPKCLVDNKDPIVAHGLCMKHYVDSRRHPEKYRSLLKKHGIDI